MRRESEILPMFVVQAFDDPTNRDRVTDYGWYCALCIVEGIRKWMLDPSDTELRLMKGSHVHIGNDPLRCVGCGKTVDGLSENEGGSH